MPFRMFHYNNEEFLRVDAIFAYGTEIEFEKYVKDLKQKLLKILRYNYILSKTTI